ncbi:ubiquinone biosynthesis monooxygenase Coq7 [Sulfuritortus calidifontis]|uniref:3-demethoxyubiquinol 3-hydroxylase n=1 Tax=Sulfuritortus calidifontis TaxID=1914471 RepID=A0A4V2UQI7_9PROT|nr:2-polyprenyl-3-methyl-6-methoxy-1,4-benzoquinone monooxygenase [Sulfuritortus calidifontis]TCS70459.1 ubiquinone biosynthesis monooxygenase Coq7 [Sulfuritortus calidifontis]
MLPIPDNLIIQFDKALRTVFAPAHSRRPHPDANVPEAELSEAEKRHAAGLMRVNHSGEVCAQALYQGQALTARDPEVQQALQAASEEETEHLAWCERRLEELGSRKSLLNPLWYAGSFTLGAIAGALGDKWNLGFLAETERQVEGHLNGHLEKLPEQDAKSRAIVEQMKADEVKHAETAIAHGGAPLPLPVKLAMRATSKILTHTAYRV